MLHWLKRIASSAPRERSIERTPAPPAAELVTSLLQNEATPPASRAVQKELPVAFARTRVIVVASQKGGAGKTTIAAHLAVQAAMMGQGPVALVDTDPQGSLTEWWEARNSEPLAGDTWQIPMLAAVKLDDLATKLAELRHNGAAVTIVDTPPALTASIAQAIAIADFVVIPARPSPHDLRAMGATVSIVRRAEKPYIFVINGAAPRANITAEAAAALSAHGRVAPVILYQRTDYAASMIDGRTVMETGAPGRSAQEIADLWKLIDGQMTVRAAA